MRDRARVSMLKHWPLVGVTAALLISVSGESFWIDELTTAWVAGQTSLRDFWAALATTGSEIQMPIFAIYIWLWGMLFGVSEIALRSANIPWAILGVLAIRRLLRQTGCRDLAILLLAAPLFSFFMNEARPYIATFASAALALTALEGLLAHQRGDDHASASDRWLFPTGLLLCAGTSMLNLFFVPALLAYGLMRIATERPLLRGRRASLSGAAEHFIRGNTTPLTVTALGLLLLAGYYIWSLIAGHGGQKQPFTLVNLGFTIYEWLGFTGLGAPRHVLRTGGPLASLPSHWPTLALGLVAWLLTGLAVIGRRDAAISNSHWRSAALAVAIGAIALIAAAVLAPASLWGRHFMFLSPLFVLLVGRIWLPRIAGAAPVWRTIGFVFLAATLALSSGQLRFHERHRKDPYRDVIVQLRENRSSYPDLPIVWVADVHALRVYGGECVSGQDGYVPADPQHAPRVIPAAGWSAAGVRDLGLRYPEYLLVLHRPRTFDAAGSWRAVATRPSSTPLWQRSDMCIYHIDSG